ncbi:MAG TPA: TldD/PmbA family protein [Chloroflexota bacterium]|nr:TldD/PmbA family protein [Chloroflexota bacterium]
MSVDQSNVDVCADVVARAKAAGAEEAEAYLESLTTRTVDARGGALESVTTARAHGVSVRVLIGGALGLASGTDLDSSGRADLAEQAVRLARASAPDPARVLPDPEPVPSDDLAIYDPSLSELSLDDVLDLLTRSERAAFATDPRIDAAHIERFGQAREQVVVVNSRGVSASTISTLCWLSLSVIAREGDDAQRGYASLVGHGPGAIDPDVIGYRAARRAVTPIGGAPLPTRRASVIFEPDVIAELVRGLAQALSGDAVVKGRSLFTQRADGPAWPGRTVGSTAVDLIEDGALPGAPGTLPFDGEGVPTRATPLIQAGVLQGFLHNCESARRAGTTSTGNGVRGSYRGLPEVGPMNLVLRPGTRAPAALVASVDEGLYVTSTRNVGGINPVSGDYSVGASGRRIVKGELAEPVSGVTLAAPMLELLANVREIGSDLRWISGTGGYVGSGTVLIDDVTIGGR